MIKQKQLGLVFRGWGGKRKGAGRKPKGLVAGVAHVLRERISGREPLQVTLRLVDGLPSLRNVTLFSVLKEVFAVACERFGFRLVHFSVQGNHLHLIAEASGRRALSRGMKGLQVRLARALNRVWERRGRVFADRYHARVLKTPREVRNALVYVLQNAAKHAKATVASFDRFSSAPWFEGWDVAPPALYAIHPPVAAPRTWLLRVGWRRYGLLSPREAPRTI